MMSEKSMFIKCVAQLRNPHHELGIPHFYDKTVRSTSTTPAVIFTTTQDLVTCKVNSEKKNSSE